MNSHNVSNPHPCRPRISKSTPGSRSNSPGAPSRRIQKLNSYLSKMANNSAENLNRASEPMTKPPPVYEPTRTASIRRWDGTRRTTTKWDSIRRVSCLLRAMQPLYIYPFDPGSRAVVSERRLSGTLLCSGPFKERCFSTCTTRSYRVE